jgi:hypothetical protein
MLHGSRWGEREAVLMSVPERFSPSPETPPERESPPPVPLPVADPSTEEEEARVLRRLKARRPLPLWLRILLLLIGWIVVLIGVAGLVLPGIQGIATILIGAAILSVASEIAYEWSRWALRRWPWLWDRMERFRDRIHSKLHDLVHRD